MRGTARLKLALVGGGPLAGQLQLSPLPHVILAGERHGTDLARWYASGDVFAFPSCSETFGNVVLEAQASGLPVVGFDTQGVNERVAHGMDGFLVPTNTSMAPALRQLCDDADLRRRFARAARAKAEAQDWAPIFDRLEQTYLRLVEEHEAKRSGRPLLVKAVSPRPVVVPAARAMQPAGR